MLIHDDNTHYDDQHLPQLEVESIKPYTVENIHSPMMMMTVLWSIYISPVHEVVKYDWSKTNSRRQDSSSTWWSGDMKNGLKSFTAVIHIPGRESKVLMHNQWKVRSLQTLYDACWMLNTPWCWCITALEDDICRNWWHLKTWAVAMLVEIPWWLVYVWHLQEHDMLK